MLISLPLWQRQSFTLMDQVSLGWTRTLAGPGPRCPTRPCHPLQSHETVRQANGPRNAGWALGKFILLYNNTTLHNLPKKLFSFSAGCVILPLPVKTHVWYNKTCQPGGKPQIQETRWQYGKSKSTFKTQRHRLLRPSLRHRRPRCDGPGAVRFSAGRDHPSRPSARS